MTISTQVLQPRIEDTHHHATEQDKAIKCPVAFILVKLAHHLHHVIPYLGLVETEVVGSIVGCIGSLFRYMFGGGTDCETSVTAKYREEKCVQGSHSMIVLVGQESLVERRLLELGGSAVDDFGGVGIEESDDIGLDANYVAVFLEGRMDCLS